MDDRQLQDEVERRRQEIAAVDDMIVGLLNRRQAASHALQMFKQEHSISRKDPEQEARVLHRVRQINPGPMTCEAVEAVYRAIFNHVTEEGSS